MNYDNDKEQELRRKEREIQNREHELRLRELELEIDRSSTETPLYSTTTHNPTPSKLQILSKKTLKFAKFVGFTVGTIALLRLGLLVGMWLAYGFIILVIGFIGYQIFLKEDDR